MRYEEFKKINFDDYKVVIENEREKKLLKGNKKILLREIKDKLLEMHTSGVSYRVITEWLNKKGVKVSAVTVKAFISKEILKGSAIDVKSIPLNETSDTTVTSDDMRRDATDKDMDISTPHTKEKDTSQKSLSERFREKTSARIDLTTPQKKDDYKPPIANDEEL